MYRWMNAIRIVPPKFFAVFPPRATGEGIAVAVAEVICSHHHVHPHGGGMNLSARQMES